MDPNDNLYKMQNLVRDIQEGKMNEAALADAAERLAELVGAMDEWLTRGGFLPDRWRR